MDNFKAKPKVKVDRQPAVISTIPMRVSLTEDTVTYTVGKSRWFIKTNGAMSISSGNHTFTCGWSTNGEVSAILYGVMSDYSAVMKHILADQLVRNWLKDKSKRPLPSDWIFVE